MGYCSITSPVVITRLDFSVRDSTSAHALLGMGGDEIAVLGNCPAPGQGYQAWACKYVKDKGGIGKRTRWAEFIKPLSAWKSQIIRAHEDCVYTGTSRICSTFRAAVWLRDCAPSNAPVVVPQGMPTARRLFKCLCFYGLRRRTHSLASWVGKSRCAVKAIYADTLQSSPI